jgi:DNA-binding MarR family transcriptional regulator
MDFLDPSHCSRVGRACVCANLRKTSRLVSQIYDEYLRPSGLKVTQFSLLMTVRGFGEITVTRLADRAVVDRTTVARNIRILEKKGLISISPGEDQRERVVKITDAGNRALESALPHWEEAQRHIEDVMGAEKTAQIVEDLSEAVSKLRQSGVSEERITRATERRGKHPGKESPCNESNGH